MIATGRFDPQLARRDFPVLLRDWDGKSLVYLDSACTALKPEPVVKAMHDFYLGNGGCAGNRSSHLLSREVEERALKARARVAGFLNAASPNEIVFTSSTTDSMNLLARSFRLPKGRDEVLVADVSHNSAFLPFLERAREGAYDLRILPSRDGRVPAEELEKALTERTALVVLSQASNVYGGVQPLAELSRAAHRAGAKVAVDAAQYVPTHRVDVQADDVDFLAFSAHKLGGPFGVGVLYGKEPLLNGLGHYRVGGGAVRDLAGRGPRWDAAYLDSPRRFEAGVQNVAGWIGLEAAIDYWATIGMEAVRAHVSGLVSRAAEGLSAVPGLRVLGRPEHRPEGSLVSAGPEDPEVSLQDLSLYLSHELQGRSVAIRVGQHCAHLLYRSAGLKDTLRLSFHAFNTEEEVDFAVRGIAEFFRMQR
jgi:cysteine desulfurase/selenocysteine lyase